jgi:hypothetical protein
MSRGVGWAWGVVALVVALSARAGDEPADKPAESKEKLVSAGHFVGKLVGINDKEQRLTVQVTYYVPIATGNPQNPYKAEKKEQDVPVKLAEEVKVRTLVLPEAFDDKGYPRRYTADELKELKGPGNLPGYTATMGDLKTGQYLRVYLVRKVPAAPAKDVKEKTPPAAPEVSVVVIVAQPQ